MMRTPDGHGKLELTRYHTPAAARGEPENPPPNTLGLHRVMFAVDDIHDTVARLRVHGAELLGEVAQYESIFLLCYLRGPAGIIVAWPNRSADASLLRDSGRTPTRARGPSPADPLHLLRFRSACPKALRPSGLLSGADPWPCDDCPVSPRAMPVTLTSPGSPEATPAASSAHDGAVPPNRAADWRSFTGQP